MYSEEVIKQELKRYDVTNSPDVSDDEVARWKESFVNLYDKTVEYALEYLYGRSWFWGKLMQSIGMLRDTKPEDVLASRVNTPEFEIGIQVAMRMLGKPIEEAKTIIEPFEAILEPKKKAKYKKS